MTRATFALAAALACAPWAFAHALAQESKQPSPGARAGGADKKQAQAPKSDIERAIEEFKAQTRNLGLRADSPRRRNGGARPAWHGRLFENFRNDFLDAVPHEIVQNGGDKSTLRRNQFGFNVAGPVIVPKLYDGSRRTFFSVSYEGVREVVSRSYLHTIPTLAERAGDWSETVDSAGAPLRIYDPASTRRNPDFDSTKAVSLDNLEYLRDLFPAARMPAGRLDPVARKALSYYPAPNTNVGPFFQNNYFVPAPERNVANGIIAKVDHNLRERHRLSFEVAYSNGLLAAARRFPNAADPGAPDREFNNSRASFGHVLTLSPTTVNSFSFEGRADASENGGIGEDANYSRELGLASPGGPEFPILRLESYLGLGRANPSSRSARNTYEVWNNFSSRFGKHGFQVSFRLTRQQVNIFSPTYPSGYFAFGPGLTSLPGIVNTGHGFASFLLGMPHYGTLSIVSSPSYFRRSSGAVRLRHTYEATQGLTFSFGLNTEATGPRVEKYNRQSTVDLDAINPANGRKGALVVAGLDGQPSVFQKTTLVLEPSASLAWNPRGDPKSVLRLAYARSYGPVPFYSNQFGTQAFNGTPTLYSPNNQLEPAFRLTDGLPPLSQTFPDVRPEAANDTTADLIHAGTDLSTYQSASISFERELPGSTLVTFSVGHAGGRNLFIGGGAANPNAIPLSALQYRDLLNNEEFARSLRPYPQYLGFDVNDSWPKGRYQRNAASVRIEKRASQGLSMSSSYEISKQMDDYSGPGTQDYFNSDNEWSLTRYNSPHRLSFSVLYELPIGSQKPFLSFTDWRRHLLNGWSVTQVSSVYSGEPLAIRPEFNNTGGVIGGLRVNVVPGVDPHVSNQGPEMWFNPAAFAQPADFTAGNASRTHPSLRGPTFQNHDLSLNKRFPLASDRSLEFTAVGLNYLNHANWNEPDVVIGPESAPNVNAGKIIGSRGGRVIQLGLRLSF